LHIFHLIAKKPPWADSHEILYEGSFSQILSIISGVLILRGVKFLAFS